MAATDDEVDRIYGAVAALCAESASLTTNLPASVVAERAGTELRLTSETLFRLHQAGRLRYYRAGTPDASFVICPRVDPPVPGDNGA